MTSSWRALALITVLSTIRNSVSFTESRSLLSSRINNVSNHVSTASLQNASTRSDDVAPEQDKSSSTLSRRAVLSSSLAFGASMLLPNTANADPDNLTPFNSLAFNYRGSEYGGLKASDIDGPSVSYKEFLTRLSADEVAFVKFLAPDGDVAFVTFKAKDGEEQPAPIQIGEGYPIEQHDGWSSPAFAIRSVKEKGVPFKFIVPGLDLNYK